MSILRRTKGQTLQRFTNLDIPSIPGFSTGPLSALKSTAVWACVRVIAETVASLPVHVYERKGNTRRQRDPQPAWLIKPNPEMTRFELFERTVASLNLDGNAYWYFEHDNLGRVAQVWPLPPSIVTVERSRSTWEIQYRVGSKAHAGIYTSSNILHFRAFPGVDDLKGLSPIANFAQSIGLGLAAEEYGARFFGQGSTQNGVIEVPGDPKDTVLKRMAQEWERDHQGVANAHRPGFLTGGAKWVPTSIPNDDAQFLQTREFQVTDIARIFRVQPHMIGDLSHATFSNIEQQSIEFVVHTIRPWLVRLESALAPLIAPADNADATYLRFNVEGLLRGDTLSRYQAYAIAIQNHWMNSDEVRDKEDLDPIPEGEGQTFYGPMNFVPLGAQTQPTQGATTNA